MGLALRPQPPRCRVVGPGGLLLVVEVAQAVRLPVVAEVYGPLTVLLVPAHPDGTADKLRGGRRLIRAEKPVSPPAFREPLPQDRPLDRLKCDRRRL